VPATSAAPSQAPIPLVATSSTLAQRVAENSCAVSTAALSSTPATAARATARRSRRVALEASHTAPNPMNRATLRSASTASAGRTVGCSARHSRATA
jgi:hypothetical protein